MNFHDCYISPKAIELVTETLKSGRVSEGAMVKRFEDELQSKFGMKHPVAVNSGTSALHLALALAGVGPGDEVILPAQTFVATGLAVLYCGAKPVFADIDPHTGNILPYSVSKRITAKTKAVIAVHWAGYPCAMKELYECTPGIPMIEDAAHALGAEYNHATIGECDYSLMACFSFQAIKSVTTGDGGAICFANEEYSAVAKRLRWFGIDREHDLPNELGERQYSLNEVGYKYHLSDYNAALGLGNLESALLRHNIRSAIGSYYWDELLDVDGMDQMDYDFDSHEHAFWLYPVLVERRDDFMRAMKSRNIPVSVVHQRIDRHPIFGFKPDPESKDPLPGQYHFDAHQVHLPINAQMTIEQAEAVVSAIKKGW